jgi:hypothetical protein
MRFRDPVPDRIADSPADRDRRIANLATMYAGMESRTLKRNRIAQGDEPTPAEPKPPGSPRRPVRHTVTDTVYTSSTEAEAATGWTRSCIRTAAGRSERDGRRRAWVYVGTVADGPNALPRPATGNPRKAKGVAA